MSINTKTKRLFRKVWLCVYPRCRWFWINPILLTSVFVCASQTAHLLIAAAALRVSYLWNASGVRDRTRATGYPPGRRGEGGEAEDQTLSFWSLKIICLCLGFADSLFQPWIDPLKRSRVGFDWYWDLFLKGRFKEDARTKISPQRCWCEDLIWAFVSLCIGLGLLNIQPSLWAGDNTPLALA